jgi:peptide methionine sulfoxide reductase MsrA
VVRHILPLSFKTSTPSSAIFAHDEEQRQEAEAKLREVRAALEARAPETRRWLGRGVVTPVEGAGDYYVAESYHQQVGVPVHGAASGSGLRPLD